jgi:glycosyltransferase involved in cell wall biosynthesis
MKRLTIATTVYNRANLINNLYESLKRQTSKDFVWIIVDDGSNDNIDEVVAGFNADFEIKFYKQKNQGMCGALNTAAINCTTEYFMSVDSDDYLVDNAVEIVLNTWEKVRKDTSIIGITAHRKFHDNSISGKKFPYYNKKISFNALNYRFNQSGETANAYRTELVKKYLFNVYSGENYMSTEIQSNKFDDIGYLYLIKEPLIVMEYLDSGLTANYLKHWIRCPKGTMELLVSKYYNIRDLSLYWKFIKRIKTMIQYDVMCMYSEYFKLREAPSRILAFICFPVALALKPIYFRVK